MPVATTRYGGNMLFEAVGTDCLATKDGHNLAAFQNALRPSTEHREADSLFVGGLSATTLFACPVRMSRAGKFLLPLNDA